VLKRHPLGLRALAGLFGHLREELVEAGSISDVTLKRLQLRFGDSSIVTLARLVQEEMARIPGADAETQNTLLDRLGGAKKTLLDFLDLQDRTIELQGQILDAKQEFAIAAEQAIAAIPGREAAEALWRYETMLERQLYYYCVTNVAESRANTRIRAVFGPANAGRAGPPSIWVRAVCDTVVL
jgi:hypothetical protein